jgi:hypothetical protein
MPTASRFVDEDFNRLWSPATLDGSRQSVELARAQTLRPIVDSVDFLLYCSFIQYSAVRGCVITAGSGIPTRRRPRS